MTLERPSQRENVQQPDDARERISVGVHQLHKSFRRTGGEEVLAVDDVTLDVTAGEMVVLLGPSGCGKTTLLRCIAGLEQPADGEIVVDGRPVAAPTIRPVPPERRNIGMMFQSYALWPHLTVRQNVAYPLQARKTAKAETEQRVDDVLRVVGIGQLAAQHPGQLSGGQQQRVALARSLVAQPAVMLFDEPLSNVDAKVRESLRYEIVEMQRRLKFAGIYVTHDQDEAMQLADRLAVMRAGKIVQIASPQEVYRAPATTYVARFVGAVNEWQGKLTGSAAGGTARVDVPGLGSVAVAADGGARGVSSGSAVTVIARPEAFSISDSPRSGASNEWEGTIVRETFAGPHIEYVVDLGQAGRVRCWSFDPAPVGARSGASVWVSVDPQLVRVLEVEDTAGSETRAPATASTGTATGR